MINFDKEWATGTYADLVADNPAGLDVSKSRDLFTMEYVAAVSEGRVQRWSPDLEAEGQLIYDGMVKPFRRRQNRALRKNIEWILDAISDPDNGVTIDPILAMPYPIGNGTDKILRYWSPKDFHDAITERYRNAATVTVAAKEFDDLASRLSDVIMAQGVHTTGALFGVDR